MVGRLAELHGISEALASAVAGHGRVIVVEGEAGIGKTRLLDTALDHPGFGMGVFRAHAEEFAARLGLKRSQLYARAVEEFLLAHDEDAVTAALDALAAEAASSGPEGSGRAAGKALIDTGHWEW